MMKLIIMLVLFTSVVRADDVSQKIDVAIELAQAGRADLARQLLASLLQTNITAVERASVLYNIATLFAAADNFQDALSVFNQIDQETLEKVAQISPQVAVQIVYNGAVSAVGLAKSEVTKILTSQQFQQSLIDTISQALSLAVNYSTELDRMTEKKIIPDVQISSFLARTYLQEEIATLSQTLQKLQGLMQLYEINKTDLLDYLQEVFQNQFYTLLDIYAAKATAPSSIALYVQDFAVSEQSKIAFCLERLLVFLKAPAKEAQVKINEFLINELVRAYKHVKESIATNNLFTLQGAIRQLSMMILLVQSQVLNNDVAALLADRLLIAYQDKFGSTDTQVRQFWQSEWQNQMAFLQRYLAQKAAVVDPFESALLQVLKKRLATVQGQQSDLATCKEDIFYWQVLSTPVSQTFALVANVLHGASHIDMDELTSYLTPLLDRLQVANIPDAKAPLRDMFISKSPLLLFQDLMEGWFYADPESALKYLFNTLEHEMTLIQVGKSSPHETFVAHADFQLFLHLLNILLGDKESGIIATIHQDLLEKIRWFTDDTKTKRPLDFYTLSLLLDWLNEMLTDQKGTLESITKNVDFGVEFQKKTMSLMRFSADPEFQKNLDLLSSMQQDLARTVGKSLEALTTKGPKIKQVISIMKDVEEYSKTQNRELAAQQKVQDLLEHASKILHSLQSESQTSEQQASSELTQNKDLSMQMQKQALRLAPDLSIRLLQEMERDDRSLQTQVVPQVSGTKPW